MTMPLDPNLEQLENALALLGPLADEMVLVGGCATGLLVTDAGAAPIRPTLDVDLVVDLLHYSQYHGLEARLRERGFEQRPGDDAPICRWWHGDVRIDVMPAGGFLGFANPWYSSAITSAVVRQLPGGCSVRCVDGPHFLATKLAAFESRGESDPVTSHDIEDVVLVFDGRPVLSAELESAPPSLRSFVAERVGHLLSDRYFVEALEGYFDRRVAAARARALVELMTTIANRR